MARALTQKITTQISNAIIDKRHQFLINGINYTSYLINWSVSFDRNFGSASATFTLNNNDGEFGDNGDRELEVGDIVQLNEYFGNDSTLFSRFYGKIEQRSIGKAANSRTITLNCLDYISVLKHWDIDLEVEGTRVEITNENLVPNYLPAPNDMFAQVFDFANNALALDPKPVLVIKNKLHQTEDPQYDGFDVHYDTGQVRFGAPINARDNHDVIAKSYFFYTQGLYAEDVLQSILTAPDGYGKYLFGEPNATAIFNNHLRTTFHDVEGAGVRDTLTPNLTSTTIDIKHQLANAVNANATSIVLTSVDGLPASGTGSINGDTFTWSNITAATKTLTGIPATGTNSLKAHPAGSYFKYSNSYSAGRVWYLTYSNVQDNLVASNFSLPTGNVTYFDKRNGRIILDVAISVLASVKCNYNYTFCTLQTAGIQVNKMAFRSRELENRLEAIQKLRKYLPPNYIIRTTGDNKIWASLLSQKVAADYTLNLIQNLNYLEDEDLFTRVVFYGKNKNPTNAMFADNVDFVTTGQSYKAFASQNLLSYESTDGGHHIFRTLISGAGYIVTDFYTPIVYINGIAVDNQLHNLVAQPVTVEATTRTETHVESSKFGGTDVSTNTYYYYRIQFAHQNIEPTQDIILYNAVGTNTLTIGAGDSNMDWGRGVYNVPGNQQNSTVEALSTATYWVRYATNAIDIDYATIRFKIATSILPDPQQATVQASYEYYTVFTPSNGVAALIDGRWDTQVQTEFFAEPPNGYQYAIIDLGTTRSIQAIDTIGGYYKPDNIRKFDVNFRFSLQYSTDNIVYREISAETNNIQMTSGQAVSFDETQLGIGFQARYILVVLENVDKLDFGDNGVWPVAFTELSIFEDVILKSTATLIPTTATTAHVTTASTTIRVESTSLFDTPSSGGTETAYIGTSGASFTYTGMTATTFTGCHVSSGVIATVGTKIYKQLEDDDTLYDDDNILGQLGDRVYKEVRISEDTLYTQSELDNLAKKFLEEFYKDHTKANTNILFAPYLNVGQTVSLTDSYNNKSNVLYFIESISDNDGYYTLTLARYP